MLGRMGRICDIDYTIAGYTVDDCGREIIKLINKTIKRLD